MLLRPELYELLGADTNLSFFYTTDPDAERSDHVILGQVAQR